MGLHNRVKGDVSPTMRAVARFVHERGPVTASNILENAVLGNGKPLRQSKSSITTASLVGVLTARQDFTRTHPIGTWTIDPKSNLLKPIKKEYTKLGD